MSRLKILLVGYGRMGHIVEKALQSSGHICSGSVDPFNDHANHRDLNQAILDSSDVVIDFSTADTIIPTLKKCIEHKTPLVIGSTGWGERYWSEVRELMLANSIGCIVGSNFSIGANILFRLSTYAAMMLRPFEQYDIAISEAHHRHKKDAPSGTAYKLAENVIAALPRKQTIVSHIPPRPMAMDELNISVLRCGSIFGKHSITIDSDDDTIDITHQARGRQGFAKGAIAAAEWIAHRKGLYTVDEWIDAILDTQPETANDTGRDR